MTAVEDRLAEIEALAAEATEGPWQVTPGRYIRQLRAWDQESVMVVDQPVALPDAAFIAAARTLVPELVAALRAVLAECDGQTRASTARISDVIAAALVVTP